MLQKANQRLSSGRGFQHLLAQPWITLLIVIALGLSFLTISWTNQYSWDTDTPSYYTAAVGIRQGTNIYDPEEFMNLANSLFGRSVKVLPYIYMPVFAQILSPLSRLPYPAFSLVFLVMNIALSFVAIWQILCLIKPGPNERPLLTIILFISLLLCRPIQVTLLYGQVSLVIFVIALQSVILLQKKRIYLSALFLAIAIIFKYYPAIFLILYMLQKRYRYIWYVVLNGLFLAGASIIIFSFQSWLYFTKAAAGNFLYGKKTGLLLDFNSHTLNTSLNGFITQLLLAMQKPRTWAPFVILCLFSVFLIVLRKRIRELIKMDHFMRGVSFVFLFSLVFSSITWKHHYVTTLLPFALLFDLFIKKRQYGQLLALFGFTWILWRFPFWGGLPFNQANLFATAGYIGLILTIRQPDMGPPRRIFQYRRS